MNGYELWNYCIFRNHIDKVLGNKILYRTNRIDSKTNINYFFVPKLLVAPSVYLRTNYIALLYTYNIQHKTIIQNIRIGIGLGLGLELRIKSLITCVLPCKVYFRTFTHVAHDLALRSPMSQRTAPVPVGLRGCGRLAAAACDGSHAVRRRRPVRNTIQKLRARLACLLKCFGLLFWYGLQLCYIYI